MTEAAEAAEVSKTSPSGPPTPIAWLMGLTTTVMTVGVIYWGVQLAQRDPASLPVIMAPDGLARLEPTTPGGLLKDYQGLAVNELQSAQDAEEGVEVISLAPAPMGLSDEDIPALTDAEETQLTPSRVEVAELEENEQIVPEAVAQDAVITPVSAPNTQDDGALTGEQVFRPVTAEEVEAAVAEALRLAAEAAGETLPENDKGTDTEKVASNTDVQSDVTDAEATAVANAEPPELAVSKLALVETVIPKPRPERAATEEAQKTTQDDLALAEQEVASATASPQVGTEVASVQLGTRMVQLGAFDSRNTARTVWKELETRNADLLSGRSTFIQPVESGGKTLFRLRVLGFETTADARNMCAALMARKTQCIAVIAR
ncbi:MAG: SPOR domain-containing protein [Pseudomonadota bacterium]